jgi:hypothetical protein
VFVLLNNNCLLHMPVSNQTTSKVCRGLHHEIFYDSVVVDVSFLVTEVFDDILLTFRVKINPAVNKSRIEHRERAILGVFSV